MTEEQIASQDLNINGFHFKWKAAQEHVKNHINHVYEDERHLLPYWEQVRLTFLELGGEKVNQKYSERF